jgi:hypothetical protein
MKIPIQYHYPPFPILYGSLHNKICRVFLNLKIFCKIILNAFIENIT